ncbi:MAG TPA: amidohydrolase family protein [Acetobacteraceae bacterium]|jgi:predicted TIM-barrel fold metal-dependent hydrolase
MTTTSGDNSGFTAHPTVRELEKITNRTDTRDVLAHASKSARKLNDYFIVDIDAHVTETAFWSEVTDRIDNDYLRHAALSFRERGGSPPGLLNVQPGMLYQDMFGRIPHGQQSDAVIGEGTHRQVELVRRAMDSMGIDYTVAFPTPMLLLGMHPQAEVEVALGRAFNRWLIEELLPREPRIKAMMYLPFNDPEACVEVVEEFADAPGVIGFTVVSTRYKPVHHNSYMRLYAALQATGKPLAFHSGFHWGDESMKQMNRFISMHAISFCYFNMIHLTNWIINGIPERFPELKVIWVESGLAWLPFMMQRLDSEYMMRSSEAPMLRRRPSEYIRDMYFTSQPLETSNLKLTQATMEAIKADTQLLFASDWPHWDFDLPTTITDLPFLSEQAKRNILGLNAARAFGFEVPANKLAQVPGPEPALAK